MGRGRGVRSETGRRGEDLAVQFLTDNGLRLLERNYRTGHMEVDLVMMSNDGKLHIVEVKSLNGALSGEPYERVDTKKRRFMISAAGAYLKEKKLDCEVQFDIVSIILDKEESDIQYIPGAFMP